MVTAVEVESLYYPVSKQKMVRGEGIYLYDEDGNAYIDCASATFNLSLGYSHPVVLAAIRAQLDDLVHITSSFRSDPVSGLAERFARGRASEYVQSPSKGMQRFVGE